MRKLFLYTTSALFCASAAYAGCDASTVCSGYSTSNQHGCTHYLYCPADTNYKLCVSCSDEKCPTGYSTSYASSSDCGSNMDFSSNGTLNGTVCGKCTCKSGYVKTATGCEPMTCPSNFYDDAPDSTVFTWDEDSEDDVNTLETGTKCYNPSGCATGYTKTSGDITTPFTSNEKSNYHGIITCYYATCNSGYTDVSSESGTADSTYFDVQSTSYSGSANTLKCGKCKNDLTDGIAHTYGNLTCYEEAHNDDYVCSEGYVKDQPSNAFIYDTETLGDGTTCYQVTGCNTSGYYTNSQYNPTYFASTTYTSHNNKTCYRVSGCATGWSTTPCSGSACDSQTSNNGMHCYKLNACASGLTTTACTSGYYTVEKTTRNDGASGYCYKCAACPTLTCSRTDYVDNPSQCSTPSKAVLRETFSGSSTSSECTNTLNCYSCS